MLVYNLYRRGHLSLPSLQESTCWYTISSGEDMLVYHLYRKDMMVYYLYRRGHVGIQQPTLILQLKMQLLDLSKT